MWQIPRVICEEFKINYPTVVYGNVECVVYKELRAIFKVIAVQDDNIHLPEEHDVALEDLWPTKQQENSAVNAEMTAKCIDSLR